MKIAIDRNVEMRTRDGCALRADVYRPDDGELHPVLLARTPYGKEAGVVGPMMVSPLEAAAAGFAMVIQDVRGCGGSDGEAFFPYRDEMQDGYDAVEWSASLGCSDGTVGCLGISYLAGTAWQAAADAPRSLKAVVAVQSPIDFYSEWWRGGALRLSDTVGWMLASQFLQSVRHRSRHSVGEVVDAMDNLGQWLGHSPLTSLPPAHPEDPEFAPFFFEILRHPSPDEWTSSILFPEGHRRMMAPALIVAGWHDPKLPSDLSHFGSMRSGAASSEAREGTRLIVGPWGHGNFLPHQGDVDFGFRAGAASIDLRHPMAAMQVKWFDQWLRSGTHEVFDEPPVWLFVQGINRWRQEDDWPLSSARNVRWYLQAGGRLGPTAPSTEIPPDTFVYDPKDPCPTRGGSAVLLPPQYGSGPVDQGPILGRRDVLVYTSDPLHHDLLVIGPVTMVLYAATSGPDTDWVVKLCDVDSDERTLNVTDGVLRARYRQGFDQPALINPDAPERYEISLDPTAMVFRSGHRMRVVITSSDFPRYDRNPNTGEHSVRSSHTVAARQSIFHDAMRASHLVLPTMP